MIVLLFIFFLFIIKIFVVLGEGKTKLHVGIFDMSDLYGRREPAPRSSPIEFKYLDYNIFDHFDNQKYYIEYKDSLVNHDTDKEYYQSIIRKVATDKQLKDPDDVIIRFASCPHRVLSHFDCMERYIHLVKGMKRVLLFDLNLNHEYIMKILHESKDFDFDSMKAKLIDESILFDEYNMNAGDTIHIPSGKFHYVECGSRENTILLSLDYYVENDILHDEFERLWPSQKEWKYEKY